MSDQPPQLRRRRGTTADDTLLTPTTDVVVRQCPRFRVLAVGKSGAGKSSLINTLFKCKAASVSHVLPGKAEIDREITSEHNTRFVLHDSQGYEPGETDKFEILKDFIERRSQEANEAERLHAIWLCISIPFAGARVFEKGDEKLFKIKRNNVPIIILFTKYDQLVAKVRLGNTQQAGKMEHATFMKIVYEEVDRNYDEYCMKPMKAGLKKDLPKTVRLSVQPGYEDTLARLVEVTLTEMHQGPRPKKRDSLLKLLRSKSSSQSTTSSVRDEEESEMHPSAVMFATAQGVNGDAKIEASINVGRQKYWRGLASSANFFVGKSLAACLQALHTDIVVVWNLPGLDKHLKSGDFKIKFLEAIDDLIDKDKVDPNGELGSSNLSAAFQAASAFATFLGHPEMLVIAPVIVGIVVLKWLYDVYRNTPATLRCLMAYIVDLTIVMHRLFEKSRLSGSAALTPAVADEVLRSFAESPEKRDIHFELRSFADDQGGLKAMKKDIVFDKIVELIEKYATSSSASASGEQEPSS